MIAAITKCFFAMFVLLAIKIISKVQRRHAALT
jgi:hypothetical protein